MGRDWVAVKANAGDAKKGDPLSPASESVLRSEEWKLAQRIIATPPFQRSAFLTNFLLYICSRKLAHREEEISEHQIGVQALGRPAAYNPGEDNIVRNYARMLRQQLEEYFAHEGQNEPLRIVIPRGRYVPLFEPNTRPEAAETPPDAKHPADLPQTSVVPQSAARLRWGLLIAFAVAAAILLGWRYRHVENRPAAPNLYAAFWSELASPGRTTYIVTGDSGFALLQDITRRQIPLQEYVNGDFSKWFSGFDSTMQHVGSSVDADRLAGYTSVADLNAVVALMRLPEFSKGNVIVRNAHEIHMGDIRTANLILFGGPLANPWEGLFQSDSDFSFEFSPQSDQRSILNRRPHPGEQAIYQDAGGIGPQWTYVILSFLPNLDGTGHALLIQGLNISGTEAGADFVLNPSTMTPILQRARLPDGTIGRFQLILRTESIGVSAPNAIPVVEHYGPAK